MRTPIGRGAAAAIAVATSLAVAWFVPVLAILLAWPLLLFLPGWSLLALLPSRLDLPGRLGLAVVLSVAVSTHLVYWLSQLTGGYTRAGIFLAAAALAVPVVAAAARGRLPHRPRLSRAGPALAVAAAAGGFVALVLGVGMWRVTPDGVSSGGSNWSDLGVHLSIAETLNAGANFPPEVPYFAGVPLVYHWFADFHAAILALAAGIFSVPAMVMQSSVLAAALSLLVYSLARALLRGPHARRVAALAAVIAVFGGGMGYIRFIGDLTAPGRSPLDLIAASSYDNQWLTGWPYFRIPSVMGTGLLAHRATTAGLPMLIGAVLLVVHGLPTARHRLAGARDRTWVIGLAGMLGALLAPFHFFFFPVFPLLALAWVVTGGRLLDRDAPRNAALLLGPYVLALPFVIAPALQASGSGSLQLVNLWPSAPREDGFVAVLFFYVTNLGVPFLLALVALYMPRLPLRPFLAAWVIGLFVIPNVVQVSVIDFDMNKYFQAMWIAVAILAAWLVRRWPMPAVAAVLLLSVPAPLLVAAWTATSNLQVMTAAELDAVDWVREGTPPDAVFVTDGWVNSLTDAAGRRRLTTFGPYIANLGYRPDERISDVVTIYCGGDPVLSAALVRRYGATYVVDGTRPQPCPTPVDFGSSDEFELVYERGPLIWRLLD
ncbi:MAG: hypothetical protein ABI841_06145 [Chloroflexota bacterium]